MLKADLCEILYVKICHDSVVPRTLLRYIPVRDTCMLRGGGGGGVSIALCFENTFVQVNTELVGLRRE